MTMISTTHLNAQEAAREAMAAYLDAAPASTPGTLLILLADLCRERGLKANAAGASYHEVAQWALWADQCHRSLR